MKRLGATSWLSILGPAPFGNNRHDRHQRCLGTSTLLIEQAVPIHGNCRMQSLQKLLASASLCLASSAHAIGVSVDMQNLELRYEFVSMQVRGTSLVHEYKSRNTYRNSLGTGWCNAIHISTPLADEHFDIESRAVIEKDAITIENCGTRAQCGDVTRYVPDAKTLARLNGTTLKALANTGEQIVLKSPETYQRVVVNELGIDVQRPRFPGGAQFYGWDGQLRRVGGKRVSTDPQGRVVTLQAADDEQVIFVYDGDHLKQIQGPNGIRANFTFDGDQMIKVDNAWLKPYTFAYSAQFNLQSIVYPDQTKFTFFHDETRDVITGLLNRNGCMETYSQIAGQDQNHYKVQAILMCNGKKMQERTSTFVFDEDGYLKDQRDVTLNENGEIVKNLTYPDR